LVTVPIVVTAGAQRSEEILHQHDVAGKAVGAVENPFLIRRDSEPLEGAL
jgi:hypothetical protein